MKNRLYTDRPEETSFLVSTFADKFRSAVGRARADQGRERPFEGWGPRIGIGLDLTIR